MGGWETYRKQLAGGVTALVFGFYVTVEAVQLPDFGESALSPGFVPFLAGVSIILLSVILVVGSARRLRRGRSAQREHASSTQGAERIFDARILISTAMIVAYMVSLNFVSFLAATPIFLASSMLVLKLKEEKRGFLFVIAIAICAAFIIRYIFRDIFQLYFI